MTIKASDLVEALGLLTRLPVRLRHAPRGAAAAWAYPLAGAVIGALAATIAWLCSGMPASVAAGFVLATTIIVTGALHEDGLADTADGLWGGWTPERRLDIMKDSRIGAFGVLALILGLGLRWAALTAIIASHDPSAALFATAILSRAPMVAVMHLLPHARANGLSASTGRPNATTTLWGLGLASLCALPLLGLPLIGVVVVLAILTGVIIAIARAKIGGQTGDILGATQQLSEIAILTILATQAT
ncbi:MAG: adenosylcobinamide-GDP ribazoletransferase [Pseudomonadota bacterium]